MSSIYSMLDVLCNFMILCLEPSNTPQAVTVSATSSRSISVSWDPVVADDRNGNIRGYIVSYQTLPNGHLVAKILNITNEEQNNRQTVTLAGLNEFTNYSIGVLAFTNFGNGPASVGQVVATLEDSKFYASICAVIVTFIVFLLVFNYIIDRVYKLKHLGVGIYCFWKWTSKCWPGCENTKTTSFTPAFGLFLLILSLFCCCGL